MTIEEAAISLMQHLAKNPGDAGVFCVSTDSDRLRVDVNFIYRVAEAQEIKEWEGFPVYVGRRSCW
jgi:hypothetical protein